MAHGVDLTVVFPRLLASGRYGSVMAARSGTESFMAADFRDGGIAYTRLWDLAAGTAIGPPIRGVVEGAGGTFGMVGTADGDRPILALAREQGVCVLNARTGAEITTCASTYPGSKAICLATLQGRPVIVSVRSEGRRPDTPCQVWDAENGDLLREFIVFFPYYRAIDEPLLLAGPELGDGIVLFATQEERVDGDVVFDYPYSVLIDLATGAETTRFDGCAPPIALHTTAAGAVAVVCREYEDHRPIAMLLPGDQNLRTFTGAEAWFDILAVGSAHERDILLVGQITGDHVTVWDLVESEPIARIQAPGLNGAAVAQNGAIVLATEHGLVTVEADALPPPSGMHRNGPRPGRPLTGGPFTDEIFIYADVMLSEALKATHQLVVVEAYLDLDEAGLKHEQFNTMRQLMETFELLGMEVLEGKSTWSKARPWSLQNATRFAMATDALRLWEDEIRRDFRCGGEEGRNRALNRRSQHAVAQVLFSGTPAGELLASHNDEEFDRELRLEAERIALDAPDWVPRSHDWWRWTARRLARPVVPEVSFERVKAAARKRGGRVPPAARTAIVSALRAESDHADALPDPLVLDQPIFLRDETKQTDEQLRARADEDERGYFLDFYSERNDDQTSFHGRIRDDGSREKLVNIEGQYGHRAFSDPAETERERQRIIAHNKRAFAILEYKGFL